MDLNEYINAERTFLHDLATPLMVAGGQAEYLIKKINSGGCDDIIPRLEKIIKATNQLGHLLENRRTIVKATQKNLT